MCNIIRFVAKGSLSRLLKISKLIPLIILFLVFLSKPIYALDVIIAQGPWCPYTCSGENEPNGYTIDILKGVFAAKRINVEIQYSSFERAIKKLRTGDIHIHPALYRTDAPELRYSEEAIGESENKFFVATNNSWFYDNRFSLVKLDSLGLVSSYSYEPEIELFKRKNSDKVHNSKSAYPFRDMLSPLVAGRLSAVYEDKWVATYYITQLKMMDQVKPAGSLNVKNKVYVAFSPNMPNVDWYIEVVDSGIRELRKKGLFQKMLMRYGVEDWQK